MVQGATDKHKDRVHPYNQWLLAPRCVCVLHVLWLFLVVLAGCRTWAFSSSQHAHWELGPQCFWPRAIIVHSGRVVDKVRGGGGGIGTL